MFVTVWKNAAQHVRGAAGPAACQLGGQACPAELSHATPPNAAPPEHAAEINVILSRLRAVITTTSKGLVLDNSKPGRPDHYIYTS